MTVHSVAFLIDYYRPFEVGGAERSAAALGGALAGAGLGVLVITPNYGAERTAVHDGVEIVRVPFPQRLTPGQLARRIWLANPLLQLAYGAAVARLLWKRGISLLHVQNSQVVLAGSLASLLSSRPMIVTIRDLAYLGASHGATPGAAPRSRGLKLAVDSLYSRLERRLKLIALRKARQIVFVSRGLQALYAREAPGWLIARSQVVHNIGPAPVTSRPEARSPTMVLFVGKLSAGKGLLVLYAAIPEIVRRVPGATFEVVGSPGIGWAPPPAAIHASVRFHGRLAEAAVGDLMMRAAVLVSPSVWPEPLSRVLLEAMSRELPIVTTAVGGSTEALDDDAAAIVPPGDAGALSDAVVRLLRERDYAARLARNASARYQRLFTAQQIVPKILDVYRTAL